MSEKRQKQIRKISRYIYKRDMAIWENSKPPRWRIFRYRNWKKAKPSLPNTEKQLKKVIKRG